MEFSNGVIKKIAGYSVHIFTAVGAVLGLWAILLTFKGFFHDAVWVLFAAVIVDAVDGTLARAVHTKNMRPLLTAA